MFVENELARSDVNKTSPSSLTTPKIIQTVNK